MGKGRKGKKGRKPRQGIPHPPLTFQGHELDPFQVDAIIRLQQQASTLVSAPTGTGKSLIADYLVDQALKSEGRVVYTAPIKALVNQKYRDFVRQFGPGACGIMTGDLTLNAEGRVVVMTTEVLRNRLLRGEALDADWVVFDEIHYIHHQERGTVWEEAILLLPRSCRILGLSATVPNIAQIAAWIEAVHQQPVYTIIHEERAVPLRHLYFTDEGRAVSHGAMWQRLADRLLPERDDLDLKAGTLAAEEVWSPVRRTVPAESVHPLDVVAYLGQQRLFPCLYFALSRRTCEELAAEVAKKRDFLSLHEKEAVRIAVRDILGRTGITADRIPGLDAMQALWYRGIGVHHAGLLPVVKHITEYLLERRILRIVYATETFAVGVNMPVRTVCFHGMEKFAGKGYRLLTQQEYLQMAGRAGRRGLDRQGTVIAVVDYRGLLKTGVRNWETAQLEPITSRFNLSYTALLNLIARRPLPDILRLLEQTLLAFQAEDKEEALAQLHEGFYNKMSALLDLGYLEDGKGQDPTLTPRGELARHVWIKELLVTEMAFDGVLDDLSPAELAGWAAAVVWEPRPRHEDLPPAALLWAGAAQRAQERIAKTIPKDAEHGQTLELEVRVAPLATAWAEGDELPELLGTFPLEAGDFVALCRQAIDLLRQLASAAPTPDLRRKAQEAVQLLDRDVVATSLII